MQIPGKIMIVICKLALIVQYHVMQTYQFMSRIISMAAAASAEREEPRPTAPIKSLSRTVCLRERHLFFAICLVFYDIW